MGSRIEPPSGRMWDGGRKRDESSEEHELIFSWLDERDFAKEQTQRRSEGPSGEEDGGMPRRSMIEGGGVADAFKEVVGTETEMKLAGLGLRDEGVAAFGDDQGVDPGGDEIVEQMGCVIGRCGRGNGWPQGAVTVGDDGGEAMRSLPQSTDIHGRNSSSAVSTCSTVTCRTLAIAAAERA